MPFSLRSMRELKIREQENVKSLLAAEKRRLRPVITSPFANLPEGTKIIAEIKKGSPTGGSMQNVNPRRQAEVYVKAGAAGVSVLCDGNYFQGSWEDLRKASENIRVPVLCKEFILFPEQVDLAYRYGADMVLLINRFLSKEELKDLYRYILQCNLMPLIEIHSPSELPAVLSFDPSYIMVNIRNLETLEIDKKTAMKTLQNIPKGITTISASGIQCPADIREIKEETGTEIFLIGTALMKRERPGDCLKEFLHVR